MWQHLAVDRSQANLLALKAKIERAGWALACPYSSSDEFEAAVIRAKRRAGVYGPRRHRRTAICAGAVTGALAVLLLLV